MKRIPQGRTRYDRTHQAERDFEAWWKQHMVDEETMGCLSPEDEEVARAVWMSAYLHFCED
jgi:hypothetical protein